MCGASCVGAGWCPGRQHGKRLTHVTLAPLPQAKIASRGFGVLDIKFLDGKVGYACGGSGSLFKTGAASAVVCTVTNKSNLPLDQRNPGPAPPCATEDGGQTWKRERAADSLAANLYELVFTPGGLGFVLGNDGVLLRVRGSGGGNGCCGERVGDRPAMSSDPPPVSCPQTRSGSARRDGL